MALRLAILGATGHIGRSLLRHMMGDKHFDIHAYARRPDAVRNDLAMAGSLSVAISHTDDFGNAPFDTVINCIGAGDPARVSDMGAGLFRITENFDNRVLDCIATYPDALYINMSSGAVYGTSFDQSPIDNSVLSRRVNHVEPAEWYGIAKRNAEAKHRAHADLNIVDIRVFSYFSRYLNLQGHLFVVDLVNALLDGATLLTTAQDSVRDYATPEDLFGLISCIMNRWQNSSGALNHAVDLFTKSPVGKFELIEAVADKFGLSWKTMDNIEVISNTGNKVQYTSEFHKALEWGYAPKYSSLDGIFSELSVMLAEK